MKDRSRSLLAFGALLFMLGLFSGLGIPAMTNPRMGLASHLEGVMNGMFLMVVGLGWAKLHLASRAQAIAFWSLLYGSYANWICVQLSAIWGTSEMTPIAGAGFSGAPWQESVISVGLVSVALSMVVGCGLLIVGFFRNSKPSLRS
jgi:hydroxylaminobenzene mutase